MKAEGRSRFLRRSLLPSADLRDRPPAQHLLYVAEDRLRDVWATLGSANWNNYDRADGAYRLMQFGTANLSLLVGFSAAIDFYNSIGGQRIEQRILELSNRPRQDLLADASGAGLWHRHLGYRWSDRAAIDGRALESEKNSRAVRR
jgi:hypothetical protein